MTRVLVTRPEGQNQPLMRELTEQGYQAIALPLLTILPFNEQQHASACEHIIEQVKNLAAYQHVVFVSTNAVHTAFHWIKQYHQQLPNNIRWYPIGTATAEALAQYVATVEQAGVDMDSETLLLNPNLENIVGDKVLIFRGQGGRDFLRNNLQSRGATVDFCEIYQRQFIRYPKGKLQQIVADGVDLLLATSTQTIQAMLEQAIIDEVMQDLLAICLIVPGQRVAKYAQEQGFQCVIASRNAGLEATMEALKAHNK